jgi:TP901 family phage tail tape measure protein
MPLDAGALIAQLKLDQKGFNAGLDTAQKSTQKIGKTADKASKEFTKFDKSASLLSTTLGKTLALGALGALTVGFKRSIDAASDFEKSMANVATLVDTSVVSIDGLSQSVLDMTTEVLKSSEDLSAGLYQVFSSGVTDSAEAMDVLKTSAIAATAGLSDTRTSVDAITTVINAYGLAASDATDVSDLMFQTVKLGKTTFSELAGAIGTVISPASSLGIKLEDLFSSIATLTKGGIDTRTATTALRATFLSILKPTDQAKEAAKELGFELSATALQSKGLINFLNEMKDATGGNTEAMSKLIPETRALNAVLALTGQQSEELNDIMKAMGDRAGSTREAFEKQKATFEATKVEIGLLVDQAKISIGTKLIPVIDSLGKEVLRFNRVLKFAFGDQVAATNSLKNIMTATGESFADLEARLKKLGISLDEVGKKDIKALEKTLVDLFNLSKTGTLNTKADFESLKSKIIDATKEIGAAVDSTGGKVKTLSEKMKAASELLGVTTKAQVQADIKDSIEAFKQLATAEGVASQDVIRLRQALFAKLKAIGEEAQKSGAAVGFDPQEIIKQIDTAQQELLNSTITTNKRLIDDTGQTVTDLAQATEVVLVGSVRRSDELAQEAISTLTRILGNTLQKQRTSFDILFNEIQSYKTNYITAEQQITQVISDETETRLGIFRRFVQEGNRLRLEQSVTPGSVISGTASTITPTNTQTFNTTVNVEGGTTNEEDAFNIANGVNATISQ